MVDYPHPNQLASPVFDVPSVVFRAEGASLVSAATVAETMETSELAAEAFARSTEEDPDGDGEEPESNP